MYLNFYGFSREPFQMAPDPAFLFLSSSHRKALDVIRRGIENRAGLMMISGAEGLGKTTLVRSAALQLASEGVKSLAVSNPPLSFAELLKLIFGQLGLSYPDGEDPFELLRRLQEALTAEYSKGRTIALFIDEAHEMSLDALKEVRMLADLDTNRDKLIQIVLVGRRPNLEKRLEAFELRPLKQRIAYRASLVQFTVGETAEYIQHRIACAQEVQSSSPFMQSAVEEIARHGRGNPSRIHIICHGALAMGCAQGRNPVTPGIVREVVADLDGRSRKPWLKWAMAPAALLLAAAFIPFFRSAETNAPFTEQVTQAKPEVQGPAGASTIPPFPGSRLQSTSAGSSEPVRSEQLGGPVPGPSPSGTLEAPPVTPAPVVTMVHPPKALSSERADSEPASASRSPNPPVGFPDLVEPSAKGGATPQSTASAGALSPDSAAPPAATPTSSLSVSTAPGKRSRARSAESPARSEDPGKPAVSPSTRSATQSPVVKEKPRSARGRPDPSEIIDWFIDKRIKHN
jgi:general secretion pathway protein A